MSIFNIFRNGYEEGYREAHAGSRRRADWELLATKPISWLPGVDSGSYLTGYQQGYADGMAARHFLSKIIPP